MRLALLLHYYFPYGGLQRDCLNFAIRLVGHGHDVTVVTRRWDGDPDERLDIVELGTRGTSNVARDRNFDEDVMGWLSCREFDCVVGFSRLTVPMDYYYAADPCYVAKVEKGKPPWYRLMPRYRHFRRLEEGLYAKGGQTKLVLLTGMEVPDFQRIYGTEQERFLVLPPSIRRRYLDAVEKVALRQKVRDEMGWDGAVPRLLFVGSGFATKGLDRAMESLAAMKRYCDAELYVAGQGKTGRYASRAKKLGVSDRVHFLGARDDAWELMVAADLLVHPARSENTGTVLLEALTAGTGVVCTGRCGFASYVGESGAGRVVESPFESGTFCDAVSDILDEPWEKRSQHALDYCRETDLYSGMDVLLESVENHMKDR